MRAWVMGGAGAFAGHPAADAAAAAGAGDEQIRFATPDARSAEEPEDTAEVPTFARFFRKFAANFCDKLYDELVKNALVIVLASTCFLKS